VQCATADPDGLKRALLIGGGIANFTDVAATFSGIIRALREKVSWTAQLAYHSIPQPLLLPPFKFSTNPIYILPTNLLPGIQIEGCKVEHLCPEGWSELPNWSG
jgi:hypothetical protein